MTSSTTAAQRQLDRTTGEAVRIHESPRASAAAAQLRYVTDAEQGWSRTRRGRGFSYRDTRGRPVPSRELDRIKLLAIPPAWEDVWICRSSNGHLQATGVDARGRKQYLYHSRWRQVRDSATFDRIALIGSALPRIREAVATQMRRRTLDQERVLAGMVRTLDRTGIRIGNEIYERNNRTIGLATLRWSHVEVTATSVTLRFPGKSGRRAESVVRDRALARLFRELSGGRSRSSRRRVFAIGDRPLAPEELNEYLAMIAETHMTAKDFRTWRGTVAAFSSLRTQVADAASSHTPSEKDVIRAIDAAAAALGNTRAVARAHYIHPALAERYLQSALDFRLHGGSSRAVARAASGAVRGSSHDNYDEDERALLAALPTLLKCNGG